MRWFAIFMLLSACFSQEILRPTIDADGGSTFNNLGCGGSLVASTSMPLSYDLAGLATSSPQQRTGASTSDRYATRLFYAWQSTTKTYTGLTLNINSSSNGYLHFNPLNTGAAVVFYSMDAGTTWHQAMSDSGGGWVQTTSTIALSTSQILSNLRVGVCVEGDKGSKGGDSGPGPGTDNVIVWDIWTNGSTTPVNTGGSGSGKGLAVRSIVGIN